MAEPRICVVIPFYQREPGVLTRAVRSILAQTPILPSSVIVVDDGSPVPATDELAPVIADQADRVRVITTENGGPARARNVGLDAVPGDTDLLAFLDSDDTWDPDYLATAVHALDLGYDLFFCNFCLLGDSITLFERFAPVRPAEHPVIDAERGLHAFAGPIVDALIHNSFVRCSMSVVRWSVTADVRFDADLRHSDEDTLYWIEVCRRCDRIVFCTRPHTRIGHGVNINAVAPAGDPRTSRILIDELRFYRHLLAHIVETEDQRRTVERRIVETRDSFVRNGLHMVARGRFRAAAALAREGIAVDNAIPGHIMPLVAGAVARKLKARIDGGGRERQ